MKKNILVLMIIFLITVRCTNYSKQEQEHFDSLEKINRSMYNFNSKILDHYLIYPLAIGWQQYIPQPFRKGIINFTGNIEEPAFMVNYFLRGNLYKGMVHFTRFFLNSTLGLFGIVDIASLSNQKLYRGNPCRFGSTLGYYGVGYGPYLHLPFYGSFTLRNDIGDIVDHLYLTLSWLNFPLNIAKWIIEGIEKRSQLLNLQNLLQYYDDPYIIVRESYFQYYDFLINKKNIKEINKYIIEDIEI